VAGVVLAAVGIFGGGTHAAAGTALMLLSGFALFAVDLWHRPGLWREVAGAFVLAKLALIGVMMLVPAVAGILFWLLIVASSIVSHAPHAFRHRRILG
jgi:hypothetical protein